MTIRATAPGRVNLIGDHTDYTGGLVLPMVLPVATTITGTAQRDSSRSNVSWDLDSANDPHPAHMSLPVLDPADIQPHWARYVAGVLAVFHERGVAVPGFSGSIQTTIPLGSGLSSSAALAVATARIVLQLLDNDHHSFPPTDLAQMCQRAEFIATGVPCGIMDQLSIIAGRPNTATLIDCHQLTIDYVDIPEEIEFRVRFIHQRALADSAYARRVDECRQIEEEIGPLRLAQLDALTASNSRLNELLRRRARHVITENQRVRDFARCLAMGDLHTAGRLMIESHWSLSQDYETSTPAMDEALTDCLNEPNVLGARITGGGFGGCLVVMHRR